ncbi:Protein of unassigned function [Burkholderia ambifaria]
MSRRDDLGSAAHRHAARYGRVPAAHPAPRVARLSAADKKIPRHGGVFLLHGPARPGALTS